MDLRCRRRRQEAGQRAYRAGWPCLCGSRLVGNRRTTPATWRTARRHQAHLHGEIHIMKALVYETAHTLDNFATKLSEVAEPTLRKFDVLVDIHATAINPGETFFRRTRSAEPGSRVLLGWEFAVVVIETWPSVSQLKIGDRVFGT